MYEKWKGVHTRCAFNMIQELIPLTRPRTLAAALGPTILGAAFSYYAFGAAQGTGLAIFHTMLIFLAVVTAQIVANLWNEYKDFKSGLDAGQKVGNAGSITRGVITPELIITMIKVLMFVPIIIGLYLSATITWYYIPVGFLCILISFLYSGGPKPISRTPFGEISSGIAMGFAIVGITLFAWTHTLHWTYLIPAVPSTILIGAIMMTNNLRDFTNDANHGRRTLVILLGRERGLQLLQGLFLISSLWILIWTICGVIPWPSLVALLSLLPAMKVIHIFNTYADPIRLNEAMKFTSISCTLYHFLWAIGLLCNTII